MLYSLAQPVPSESVLTDIGRDLLLAQLPFAKGARLLGLGVHNLVEEKEETAQLQATQLTLAF